MLFDLRLRRYDCVLHSKFRFRSATFYKTSKLELAFEKHKDRVLVTGLRTLPKTAAAVRVPSVDMAAPSVVAAAPSATSETLTATEDLPPPPKPQVVMPPQSVVQPAAVTAAVSAAGSAGGEHDTAEPSSPPQHRLIAVINCHLTGGPAPERRMRQVLDGLDAARKESARFLAEEIATAAAAGGGKGKDKGSKKGKKGGGGGGGGGGSAAKPVGTSVPVVVCGDFNSNGRTAVWELLTKGVVEASYRERGYPEVSSRNGIVFVPMLLVLMVGGGVEGWCGWWGWAGVVVGGGGGGVRGGGGGVVDDAVIFVAVVVVVIVPVIDDFSAVAVGVGGVVVVVLLLLLLLLLLMFADPLRTTKSARFFRNCLLLWYHIPPRTRPFKRA